MVNDYILIELTKIWQGFERNKNRFLRQKPQTQLRLRCFTFERFKRINYKLSILSKPIQRSDSEECELNVIHKTKTNLSLQ